ncbi:MAG: hypothetical protein AB7E53_04475 [Macellibacteroides sp.]|uniref:hypothetical protein n=1 Tax=Macellibacteroides sp. TaxID=2014584 RepID=UPI003E7787BA
MKQVKQIIEFILVVASCFFRKRKQQKAHPHVPEDPYPPGTCNGRKGDCPGCTGCNCDPQSAPATGYPDASEQYGASNLLGWCLIAVAGTSYLYKLLL